MEVSDLTLCKKTDWCSITSKDKEILSFETDDETGTITFIFDKDKVKMSELMSPVMELTDVKDVKIQETELADIVKEIYSHGLSGLNRKGE